MEWGNKRGAFGHTTLTTVEYKDINVHMDLQKLLKVVNTML
jgi:hypothetical protein